jgi:putative transport protein
MNNLLNIFTEPGVGSTLLYLCMTAFTGVLLGKTGAKGIKLGVGGVLFSGILIAHLGAPTETHTLHFVRDFGLILFVYSIGLNMGPRFLSSFKKDGLQLNLLALGVILSGFGLAYLLHALSDHLSPAIIIGLLCGAVTNTPSLGAAQQALAEQGIAPSLIAETGMAYAIAYPFGVIGIILALLLLKTLFGIKTAAETEKYTQSLSNSETKLQSVEITVSNPNLFGKNIDFLKHILDKELAISRIIRRGETLLATDEENIHEGDLLCGVSEQKMIENLTIKIGPVRISGNIEEITGPLAIINVLMTNPKLAGKTIEQVGIYRRYPANITRIFRSGIKILPTLHTTLEMGDTIKIVGKKEILHRVKKELGDSVTELAKPNITSIFLGLLLGLLLGSIPLYIPGLPSPAKLGLAGGPLLIAILLGHKGRIGNLHFYMTPGANYFMREIGIILFLSSVGLLSGGKFLETLLSVGWRWILPGIALTFLPILTAGILARLLKINYLKICGFIAGSMTDPPALEFANALSPVQAQSTAYAVVYPLTMFLRVLLSQIFVLTTL